MKLNVLFFTALLVVTAQLSFAQDDPVLPIKMQFSSMMMGMNDNFKSLKGEKYADDDNFTYFGSEYGLGDKAVTILQSKKDTSTWYCYIKYNFDTELEVIPNIQNGVFALLNMIITGGKIRGTENTESGVTRTDLFVKSNDTWMGELVTDSNKKSFHILLQNTPWQ